MILGVDVGGTFTDLFFWDGSEIHTAKLPTTTADQSEAVLEGAAELADHVESFLHGTTAATNALLPSGVTATMWEVSCPVGTWLTILPVSISTTKR